MKIILKTEWEVLDGSERGKKGIIPAGTHEIERIKNPRGFSSPWLVLKGTLFGQCEGAWRQWEDSIDENQVCILD